jgi:hypothetical protein
MEVSQPPTLPPSKRRRRVLKKEQEVTGLGVGNKKKDKNQPENEPK